MRQNIYRHRAGDAAFFREQDSFGKRQHLNGETQVYRNLHGKRKAVVTT